MHLFLHKCLSLTGADLWPPRWCGTCQVQVQVEVAFPGYNSMVVATWLDPPCELTQSIESDTSEGLKLALHVGHVLEWLLFFDSLPFLLSLPEVVEELGIQLIPILILAGGVVVQVEASEDVVQVLSPPCVPVISEVPQRVSREGLLSTRGGGWRGTTRHPSWASILLAGCRLIGLPNGGSLSSSSGTAGRPTAIISALGSLSPTYVGVGAFHGNGSQMEAPGGAGTSLDIPLEEVLRVVTPLAEAVVPYPGVCSKIWLHDIGGADGGTPTHLQCGSRLQQWQQNPTPVAASHSWSKFTTLGSKQLLSLGGSACRLATTS